MNGNREIQHGSRPALAVGGGTVPVQEIGSKDSGSINIPNGKNNVFVGGMRQGEAHAQATSTASTSTRVGKSCTAKGCCSSVFAMSAMARTASFIC